MRVFHLIDDHDGNSCPEMVRHAEMLSTGEVLNEPSSIEEIHGQPGDSGIHFLEYESEIDRGGDILVTLEDPSCVVSLETSINLKIQALHHPMKIQLRVRNL